MSESIVNALVHLFAIFESVKESFEEDSGKLVVKPYLEKTLNQELTNEYLKLFYDYLSFYQEANLHPVGDHELGIDSTSIIQIAKICNQLTKELVKRERITVFIQLLELIEADKKVSAKESEFASLVAMNLNLDQKEVKNIKSFIFDLEAKEIDPKFVLQIDNKMTEWPEEVAWMMRKKKTKVPGTNEFKHHYVENFYGKMLVLYIPSVETFVFRYDGPLNLYLEGNKIIPRKSYFLRPGSIIKGPNIESIYETVIIKQFIRDKSDVPVVLSGEDLEFSFKNSDNGIKKFNFAEESGHLVGVMGGSGTGKSTLINLLNGKLESNTGRVHINGYQVDRAGQEGVIGYVPQDDLLFEELTVYQNLYFNAQICFSDFNTVQLTVTVEKVLNDLDLFEIRDLKVGDPLNKTISGGQRKRLNIALELMREPAVLFVDEPTSGLSSMDSEKVMLLLKDLARKGKLVMAIIHQPSSDIFKLFDRLWILDKGGYPIYNGNPIDAVVYFKTMSTQVNAAESECQRCGNVIPEQILQIIEAKEIDDNGDPTSERRVSPKSWYLKYKENIEKRLKRPRYEERLPPTNFNIPNRFRQLKIFSKRNLLSKLSNTQYILINLLEPPLLALILGYFSKYADKGNYVFADNKNLPVFLFMSVVVSLFMGMSVSAEEIFKDKRILERESFLNLSRLSYVNSKLVFLFGLSAIQSILFIGVGSWILELKGMSMMYFVVLFSTSCFANLVGLNISSALNSIIAIYILIPFILVPQLLLGGAMIRFDDLHHDFTNQKYVPVVGDLMVSRWSYEALSVAQYKHNLYERNFYETDMRISNASFQNAYIIPRLRTIIDRLNKTEDYDDTKWELDLLRNEFDFLSIRFHIDPFPRLEMLYPEYFNESLLRISENYVEKLARHFRNMQNESTIKKDAIYDSLVAEIGQDNFYKLKSQYYNKSLSDIMTNRDRLNKIYIGDKMLIQKKDPIYMEPYSNYGRAHFYSPIKRIGDLRIDTVWFNVLVIWSLTLILYIMLLYDTLKRIVSSFSGRKIKKTHRV